MKKPQIPADIAHALRVDGAIRMLDGRWSLGFVEPDELKRLIRAGVLRVQKRHGMSFAVWQN